jgi:hypothetical protein
MNVGGKEIVTNQHKARVFISHNSEDAHFASELAMWLRERGFAD